MFQGIICNRRKKATLILIMGVVIVAVYYPVLLNGFADRWDDNWMVIENPYLNELSFPAVGAIFTEPYGGQYSPLNTLAYSFTKQINGTEPSGFHLMSLFIHLVNALLTGLLLEKLLGMIRRVKLEGWKRQVLASGTALLFALHPMQVESVAWISASKVLLYSFFYLLGLLMYLHYRGSGKRKYYWLVLLFFLCSLLSKEQAVVFMLSLIATDLVTLDNLKNKQVWLEKIPFLVLAVLFSGLTLWIQKTGGSGLLSAEVYYPFWQRAVFACYSFWEYLIRLIIPYSLSHFYFFPMDVGESLPLRLWFYPVATGFLIWLLVEYRWYINRIYLYGGLFFLINIALVLHLIPTSRMAIIADRYVYLSSIGFFLIVIYALMQWLNKRETKTAKVVWGAVCIYVIVLAGYTHHRTGAWKSMETLNRDVEQTVEKHMGDVDYLENVRTRIP